ncbi:DNA cytosine methyltransferase [Caldalkalibacillus thermarum TA2.A1]|uniref:DNA (cytosine-5-)-methyltransferase n=2 Tax=Caldalkalibacillus thermarum (strain TA2.A1) TaxID=986075 RepID=A0A8X8I9W2_CALTT|nr:DNA cytosine methyltransferase [Caldalkalibacillus thermarum]QZT33689.1 DNA cytosine methyltransferase [Caldalkalibacillus thermarum TA2.A1]
MTYPVISLFSGAMGLDLGLEQAGLKIMISQDIDPWCVKTAKANGFQCIQGDIRKLIAEDTECSFLLKPANLLPEEPFAVVGGPPCQPFSTAGKRLGTNDPRGSLFMEFIHVIKMVRPRFFVMENVKGLLSVAIKHRPLKERNEKPLKPEERPGSAFEIIKQTFAELGYKIIYGVLDAVHYGVPQFRERLIIIGSRDHEDIFLPKPTHFQVHQDPSYRWRTLREVIEDLENNPGPCASFSPERIRFLRMVPMGGNWRNLPPEVIPEAMGGAYKSSGGKVGFYRRLDYDQPSPTLVTSPIQKATMLCHPTQDRPLSVREYARIQQFPDDWKIEGKLSDCYRQIGNAVPLGLGKAIGQMLISVATKSAEIKTRRVRGTSVHKNMSEVQRITLETII